MSGDTMIHQNGHPASSAKGKTGAMKAQLLLLDLPDEILSQIASYLPLPQQLGFLSLHPTLLSLTRSHDSPIPPTIRSILASPYPYPPIFARLPSLRLYIPDDGGRVFIDVLVCARPRWILERLEFGRWSSEIWKEAFERRFLRSWRRYKTENDSWRSIFLRMLGRLEHRNLACTHEESWTRFITLHRNGSASINRIYSRLFDPYDIYDELKHQNNFAAHPTQVRVLLHLQDVRILAIGTLISQPSLFVNPNAHLLLHPPLLRDLPSSLPSDDRSKVDSYQGQPSTQPIQITVKTPIGAISPSANPNEAYFPLVRSISPSGPQTTYGLGEAMSMGGPGGVGGPSSFSPSSPGLLSTFARVLPGRTRRSSSNASEDDGGWRPGGVLTRVMSRDRDRERERDRDGNREEHLDVRRRAWSFGRSRASEGGGTTSITVQTSQAQIQNAQSSRNSQAHMLGQNHIQNPGQGYGQQPTAAAQFRPTEPLTPSMPTLPELSPAKETSPPTPPHTPPPPPLSLSATAKRVHLPYPRLLRPQPAASYHNYPNYPPLTDGDSIIETGADSADGRPLRCDRRALHEEVEDEGIGAIWSENAVGWGDDGVKMAEWDAFEQVRKRWVGPMILVAQLHPSDRHSAHPPGADPNGPVEGSDPDLGPKGMYASLGFEDVQDLMPWVELRGGGGNSAEAMRSGLGFE